MTNTRFDEVRAEHMERLEQFTPIVERVHGGYHPEFYKVHQLFKRLNKKLEVKKVEQVDLSKEFKDLRTVTDNYTVPNDVCESYAAVYNMLEDLDQAYLAQ